MKLFLQLTKVDVEKREVWGRATQEVVDKSGEIFDYATSKPNFETWSAEFEKATDGKSLGNVRAMHGAVAAGKVISIEYNDAEKAIDIGTKIVDDAEMEKVKEGVYTGFSIGGSYAKRWQDGDNKRFTAVPAEISLVDNPCVPTAHFAMIKADGTVEEKSFRDPVEQVWRCGAPECFHKAKAEAAAHRAEALAKIAPEIPPASEVAAPPVTETAPAGAAKIDTPIAGVSLPASAVPVADAIGKGDTPKEGEDKYGDVKFADPAGKKYPVDTEAHIRAAWSYINKAKNGAEYSAAELTAVKDRIIAAWKKTIDQDGPPSAAADKAVVDLPLAKSMWSIGDFANALQALAQVADSAEFEAQWEGDSSDLPAKLRAWLAAGAPLFTAMATEEITEMIAQLQTNAQAGGFAEAEILTDAARAAFGKKGARHSAVDQKMLQAIHDTTQDLGAHCAGAGAPDGKAAPVDLTKLTKPELYVEKAKRDAEAAAAQAALAKVESDEQALQKANADALAKVTAEKDALAKRVQELEARPAVPKAALHAVEKSGDLEGAESATADLDAQLAKAKTPEEIALIEIKKVRRAGGVPYTALAR